MPSNKPEYIDLAELGTILHGRPGLIIGPNATLGPGVLAELVSAASESDITTLDGCFSTYIDDLILAGTDPEIIQHRIRSRASSKKPTHVSHQLANVRWSSVMSLDQSSSFEEALRSNCAANPAWPEACERPSTTAAIR